MYEVDLRERIALALIAAGAEPFSIPEAIEGIVAAVLKPIGPEKSAS